MSDIIEVKGQYYIRANASIADAGTRVLKYGELFAVFDRHGDVRPLGFENHGVFFEGTRFLSRWKLKMNGTSPLLLSSNVKEDNDFLVVDMTNPVLKNGHGTEVPHSCIHLVRHIFLWQNEYFERVDISNFWSEPVKVSLELEFEADFTDVFELRGSVRKKRGTLQPPQPGARECVFRYEGLDGVRRETRIDFNLHATNFTEESASFEITLKPQEQKSLEARVACIVGQAPEKRESFEHALNRAHTACDEYNRNRTALKTSNPQFNDWLSQSSADLHMLLTTTPKGPYPFAGIPWFSCIFGRDGIITALETLWMHPEIARAVLAYLGERQATSVIPEKDAEPGKILHEERKGEMAALNEVPFGCYYGSIDSTPLWLLLAGAYYERTADREFIAMLWPAIERALKWIDVYGDRDGDGFVEYQKATSSGLVNQGWKDSEDSVFHEDGTLPKPPIALCEVQGYVYQARLGAAAMAEALGKLDRAKELREAARRLKQLFHEKFWCERIGSYVLALDGEKKQCQVPSSNAGQCLFTGIAGQESAARLRTGLMKPEFFSGWGIRTIPAGVARYNPMSYHDGSVWPHDNALIAFGLAQYGFKEEARKVTDALFSASRCMDLNRLPELYCGFEKRRGEGPTLYPVACNPQAWSSGAAFFALQACLGLRIDAAANKLSLIKPLLPTAITTLHINELKVGSSTVDLTIMREDQSASVNIRRRTGDVEILVAH